MAPDTDEVLRKKGSLAEHLRDGAFSGLSIDQQVVKLAAGMAEGVGRVEDLERGVVSLRNQIRSDKDKQEKRTVQIVFGLGVPLTLSVLGGALTLGMTLITTAFAAGQIYKDVEYLRREVVQVKEDGRKTDERLRSIELSIGKVCASIPECEL